MRARCSDDRVFAEVQVIVCRERPHYFGSELKQRVLQKVSHCLRPGGFLCLGSSERLDRPGAGLYTALAGDERIYQRGGVS